jgi:HK97 family phage prohead protease
LQIRASQENEYALVGRAVKYNEISSNELATGLRERIMPGCFAASLAAGGDVKALLNHDQTGLPLGRLANGTLRLTDSEAGLDMRIQLDRANSMHKDVFAAVKRQDISEMSFSFSCEDEDVSSDVYQGNRCQVRNVRKASLYDVSIVTSPFYGNDATAVAARNNNNVDETFRRLSARATESIQQADEQRRRRAAQLVRSIEAEKEEEQELENACERACRAAGLDYCSHDEDYVFAGDANEPDENCCYRFEYEQGDDGEIVLDLDSRAKTSHELLHSERGRRILWLRSLKRKAGRNG